jgi:hypothetical protein
MNIIFNSCRITIKDHSSTIIIKQKALLLLGVVHSYLIRICTYNKNERIFNIKSDEICILLYPDCVFLIKFSRDQQSLAYFKALFFWQN